ncbi:hypothetical protein [Bacillus atrophaeus]|uniref:hypothetical protein n=1 Tax=Bacillus atrophaeus TaxID=1452 RepID=UPI00227FF69C|nr:hypothetical protein [Bacillus atrophaeus]MCY8842454.1 hypothetical protein [Bacillus atrophaeus]MEC0804664.1 hypothetical protein [Bacillus atrophaeus]MEC0852581.1 hypothetical protein [Bacillus atrophaeus]MEC0859493.1 hypothetical protein [Bacillus atrophaeus]MEC0862300.1 hypothetical protein [Bacillus atrophaeus]
METKDYITIGSILVTLIIGILSLVFTIRNSRKTLFVNAVTSERVKWMAKIRELMSEFLSITRYYEGKELLKDKAKYFERLYHLQSNIELHLNNTDKEDKEINDIVNEIISLIKIVYNKDQHKISKQDALNITLQTQKLVEKSKVYLKNEWEKVKKEAEKGNIKKDKNKIREKIKKTFQKKMSILRGAFLYSL